MLVAGLHSHKHNIKHHRWLVFTTAANPQTQNYKRNPTQSNAFAQSSHTLYYVGQSRSTVIIDLLEKHVQTIIATRSQNSQNRANTPVARQRRGSIIQRYKAIRQTTGKQRQGKWAHAYKT